MLEASALIALMNLVIIPSSILWGAVTDRITGREILFAVAYFGSALVFACMFGSPTIASLTLLAGCLGFVWVANVPATNLRIMETSEKKSWFACFANAGLISNLGAVVGLIAGLIWSSLIPLEYFFVFCAASCAVSFLMATRLVGPVPMTLEIKNLLFVPWSALNKTYNTLNLVTRWASLVPSRLFATKSLTTAYKTVRASMQESLARMFLASFLFVLGSSFLGASYVPFLSVSKASYNVIFGVTLANTTAQIVTYRFMENFRSRLGDVRIGSYSTMLTCICFALVAASASFLRDEGLIILNLIVYLGVGLGVALWNAFNSATVLSQLSPESQGGTIGVFSALNSFGTVIGSILSGVSSLYVGYWFTFFVASGLILSSQVARRSD